MLPFLPALPSGAPWNDFTLGLKPDRFFLELPLSSEVWARFPRWRWAARAAALPGAMAALEFGYSVFLPIRPFVSRLVGKMQKRGTRADGAKRG